MDDQETLIELAHILGDLNKVSSISPAQEDLDKLAVRVFRLSEAIPEEEDDLRQFPLGESLAQIRQELLRGGYIGPTKGYLGVVTKRFALEVAAEAEAKRDLKAKAEAMTPQETLEGLRDLYDSYRAGGRRGATDEILSRISIFRRKLPAGSAVGQDLEAISRYLELGERGNAGAIFPFALAQAERELAGGTKEAEMNRYAAIERARPLPWPVAWQGTAADTPGVDPYAPLRVTAGDNYDESLVKQDASDAALDGETHPYSLLVGTPRIYRYDLTQLSPAAEGKGLLQIKANLDWRSAFNRKAPDLDDVIIDDAILSPLDEEHFETESEVEQLWRDLIDDARKLAKDRGYAAFELTGGLRKNAAGLVQSADEMVFLTDPQSIKPTATEVVGYLPGMPAEPDEEDLVLYHGGQRILGEVGLDFRATSQGENLEPLPILLNTPAVWAKGRELETLDYTQARAAECEKWGMQCEPHIYTLDAANAEVAEVSTKYLTRRRANAVVRELLKRKAAERPDILRLQRESGGEEYFIPEGDYEPTIVRVKEVQDDLEIPGVQTVEGLEFAPPSADFCEQPALNSESEYWEERCEGNIPLEEADNAVVGFERLYDDTESPVQSARFQYWRDVLDGKELKPAVEQILAAAPRPPGKDLRLKALAALDKDYEPPRPGRRSKGGRRGREKERPGKGGGSLPSITLARE